MKRVIALVVLALAASACAPLAEQPQIVPTPRAGADATQAVTVDLTAEATIDATVEATVEATNEATPEATEAAAQPADIITVADVGQMGSLGETLFRQGAHGAVPCAGCHAANSDARLVGPGLLTVAARAETRSEGLTAAEYLHESIVDPGAFVVAGYFNMMPKDFAALYSDEEIDALVDYMLTLNEPAQVAAANAG